MIFTTSKSQNFKAEFEELLNRGKMDMATVSNIVGGIIDEIKQDKNKALFSHISKFDNWTPTCDEDLKISTKSMQKAYDNLDENLKKALHLAYDRIKSYHEKQKP
ncbi:MAG: histidinol dehydrogenase, partial [Campylobacterales bacterium]